MKLKSSFLLASRQILWGVLLAMLSGGALAEYRYTYTGNFFTMSTQTFPVEPGDPSNGIRLTEQVIQAVIYTATPLSAGDGLDDVLRISMSWVGASGDTGTIDYPSVPSWDLEHPPDPLPEPGTPGNPEINAQLMITAVDANGLPTEWDLTLDYQVGYPTGRWSYQTLTTSQERDSVEGEIEPYVIYSGELTGNPGIWEVTVVPEPANWALMLGGLGLLALAAKRRGHDRRPWILC